MIVQRFCNYLNNVGFTFLKGECAEINYLYRVHEGTVICLHVCDFSRGVFLSDDDLYESLQNMKNYFASRGYYDVQKISLIFAYDMSAVKHLMSYNTSYWVIDLESMRLVIYENQPDDFFRTRRAVEAFVENARSNRRVKREVPTIKLMSPLNTIIVLVNIIVFIITEIAGDTLDAYYMYNCGAMFAPAVTQDGEVYRIITSMFLHFGVSHLAGNMTVLLLLGDNVERALGKVKYVILYMLSGICAGACSAAYNLYIESNAVCAGASGAIFGVIGALLYIVWANKGRLDEIRGSRLTLSVLYMLYSGFTGQGIDNAAHIGGLLAGILFGALLYRTKNTKKEKRAA